MDPKSSRMRFWRVSWRPQGAKSRAHAVKLGGLLTTIFIQTNKKWHPKRHPQNDAEQVLKMYAETLPTWMQIRCQNELQINAKIGIEKKIMKIKKIICFVM